MSAPNTEKIQTLISECRKATSELSIYAATPRKEILASSEKLGNLKYQCIIAVESAIDICLHISAKEFNEVPVSYAGCFDILEKKSIVGADLAVEMSDLARFRNVLVHRYWAIDNEKVLDALSKLPAIERYLHQIAQYCGFV